MKGELIPAFKHGDVAVTLASDEKGVPLLGVTLRSVIAHASPEKTYDIVVMGDGISSLSTERIVSMAGKHENISIRIIPASDYLAPHREEYVISRFPAASSLRYFIPSVFRHYKKVLYLDTDIILRDDVAQLWEADPGLNWLGVVPSWSAWILEHKDFPEGSLYDSIKRANSRGRQLMGWANTEQSFCAGVLLFNIPVTLREHVQEKLIGELVRMRSLLGHSWGADNDVLVGVCAGHLFSLPYQWQVVVEASDLMEIGRDIIPADAYNAWCEARKHPSLIHYAGACLKPWHKPTALWAAEWWMYARQTPFYEAILYQHQQREINAAVSELSKLSSLKRKKRLLKWLIRFHLGKKKRLMAKQREITDRIRTAQCPFPNL